jgi:hypothetical protein
MRDHTSLIRVSLISVCCFANMPNTEFDTDGATGATEQMLQTVPVNGYDSLI